MKPFLEASVGGKRGEAAILGIPFDGTSSFRAGCRFGPEAIREASYSLETFSPFQDCDLKGRDYLDFGDLDVAPGSAIRMVEQTQKRVSSIIADNLKPVIFGGEHTVTVGVVQALVKKYPDMGILQLDAHTDFRDEFLGEKYSHATVIKRISELIDPKNIFRVGIRSGSRDELVEAGIKIPLDIDGSAHDMNNLIKAIPQNMPLYITVDLDVFDPSLVPGVGNPEPHGFTWREFIQLSRALSFRNTIGFDVVELSPHYDPSGVSAIVAASAVRELLISIMN